MYVHHETKCLLRSEREKPVNDVYQETLIPIDIYFFEQKLQTDETVRRKKTSLEGSATNKLAFYAIS